MQTGNRKYMYTDRTVNEYQYVARAHYPAHHPVAIVIIRRFADAEWRFALDSVNPPVKIPYSFSRGMYETLQDAKEAAIFELENNRHITMTERGSRLTTT